MWYNVLMLLYCIRGLCSHIYYHSGPWHKPGAAHCTLELNLNECEVTLALARLKRVPCNVGGG